MARIFFTYVWGHPGNPCWPLTFGSKAARTQARRALTEGDFVFTVGTKQEPTAPEDRGRVLGLYQVSDLEVNTRDYANQIADSILKERAVVEFPVAMHPIAVWEITDPNNIFSDIVGRLTRTHHLTARNTVAEIDGETGQALLALKRRPVQLAKPTTFLGRGLVAQKDSKLAPKHEGEFSGRFGDHAIWYVYALALEDRAKRLLALKLGYSNEPEQRCNAYQTPMAGEVTGLSWRLAMKQPTGSEDEARQVEQELLKRFESNRLQSNREIIAGPTETAIMSAMVEIMGRPARRAT
ncbi:GIY-YIG nuclease family protein [Zhengella sp. ZM62]|uniref:GIY-YIG nuclease family protein n=1 Tax=Zhengella sedimenti TaxID=3390035 RepID=UPI0039755F43